MELIERESYIKKKIDTAKYIMQHKRKAFYRNSIDDEDILPNCYSFYIQTNENLNYYYQLPSMEGKDVLVPTASGDHALNAIYFGANSVETFDINEFAFLQYDLKETAIKCLSRRDFLKFYSKELLHRDIYEKFSKYLQPDTKEFFDGIYDFLESVPEMSDYIHNFYMDNLIYEWYDLKYHPFQQNNPYLQNEEAYYATRDKLEKLKKPVIHKLAPAHELDDYFDPKDVIIYSNILKCYFDRLYDKESYNIYKKNSTVVQKFLKSLAKVLKDEGYASIMYNIRIGKSDLSSSCERYLGLKTDNIFIPRKMTSGDRKCHRTDRIDIVTKANNPSLFEK